MLSGSVKIATPSASLRAMRIRVSWSARSSLGGADVDDQIDESATLRGDRLGGLFAQSAVLVRGDWFVGEHMDDDAGRHGFHVRTMHIDDSAIKQAQTSLFVG